MFSSTKMIFNDVQLNAPKADTLTIIGNDTIRLSEKIYNIPSLRVDDIKKKEPDYVEKKFYFNAFPGVLNWIVFHCIALSIGISTLPFILLLIVRLRKAFNIKFKAKHTLMASIPLGLVVGITIIFASLISSDKIIGMVSGEEIMVHFNIIFSNPEVLIRSLVLAFLFLGFFSLIGIMMVNISISKLSNQESSDDDKKKGFKLIKDNLNIFALYSGLILGVAIIGTGLQRDMIAEQLESAASISLIFPDSFIYSYGIAFTFVLALFFLPSLVYLKYAQKKTLPLTENKTENTSWWRIGTESIDDIKLIFSIVLPLISSVVQHFI